MKMLNELEIFLPPCCAAGGQAGFASLQSDTFGVSFG
jgi:hypothetical protein